MARVFCLIFSFYLLLLSFQPCQDLAAIEIDDLKNEATQSLRAENRENESDCRECSPFCFCSCRQMPLADDLRVFFANEEISVFAESILQSSIEQSYQHQYHKFIWQPPKFKFTA